MPFEQYQTLAGLSPQELTIVQRMLQRRHFRRGDVIVEYGAPAGELFFLARGSASVRVQLASGGYKRLATFSAGMSFGEMAMLERAKRSAIVTADTDVICDLLPVDAFEALEATQCRIQALLLRNLARDLSLKLRKANREMSVFD